LKKKNKLADRAASSFLPPARPNRAAQLHRAHARSRPCGPTTRCPSTRAFSLYLSLTSHPHMSSPSFRSLALFSPTAKAQRPTGDHNVGHPTKLSNMIYPSPRTDYDLKHLSSHSSGPSPTAMAARRRRHTPLRQDKRLTVKLKGQGAPETYHNHNP
jgi:hypothetical protein